MVKLLVEQAEQWFLQSDSPEGWLPSARQCVKQTGLPMRAVRRAIENLREKGWLQVLPNKGLVRPGYARIEKDELQSRRSYHGVADRIIAAIQSGTWSAMPRLPQSQELQSIFAVSAPTLRKALAVLHKQGVLERSGGGWRIRESSNQATSDTLNEIWLVIAVNGGRIRMDSHREIEFMRAVEEECRTRALRLRLVGVEQESGKMSGLPRENYRDPVGVLFSPWHMQDSASALRKVVAWGYPVSVWLEMENPELWINRWKTKQGMAFFSIGYGKSPGREVGRYLWERGHRKVAYLSAFHGSTWSKDRCEGLREIVGDVEECVDMRFSNDWSFRDRIDEEDWFCTETRQLLPPQWTRASIKGEGISMQKWRDALGDLARDCDIIGVMEPLVRKAMESKATAWVFSNDALAVFGLSLCIEIGLPREKWPEMVAFDNSPASFRNSIDSFEFGTRAMVQGMVRHVLAPSNPVFATGKIHYPKGYVVCRSTVIPRSAGSAKSLDRGEFS